MCYILSIMGGWSFETEQDRHKAEGAVSSVKKRIKNKYGGRGFLRFYDRAERLLSKLHEDFPEAQDIEVRTSDVRDEFLTKLLKVMYLKYGRSEFGVKAIEWLQNNGENIPTIEFRVLSDEEIKYEAQLYNKVAEWIISKERISGDYIVETGKLANPTKYGNPDVVIIRKIKDTVVEIIVAEVKNTTDVRRVFEGFGQACAYKLFSHVQYLVIPAMQDDSVIARLKRLCSKVQIKLATFTGDKIENLRFELEEGSKGEPPDYEAMEEFLSRILP